MAEKYVFDSLDADLRAKRDEGASLRKLESEVNRTVLEAAVRASGMNPLPGDVENIHRFLTDEVVSSGGELQAHDRL